LGKVIFRPASYEYNSLRETAIEILEAIGSDSIRHGTNVLIKPNLLSPALPQQAITTHSLLIRAVAEYALEKGARVSVSDSNAVGSFDKVITSNGLKDALKGLDLTLGPLEDSVKVETGEKFSTIELSREVLEADLVINLPKLKTHAQMGLTLAVKNLFGCVVGLRKPEWHFRVGEDKELFAELLATIYMQIKPSINLMDSVLAMEGQGPGTRGTPREVGYLIGGTDALELDMAACRLVGMDPFELLTTKASIGLGASPEEPEMDGFPGPVEGYVIPEAMDLVFGPRFTRGFFRRHIADRPVNIESICKYCNECVNICPAKAIVNMGMELKFNYDKCIRCYCCVEVCPHAAMEKRSTWLKRFMKKLHAIRG
jgi:uncharacterized protein (DUF362 family)/Pyruvate/2-oxoacid:ferredoxin oxidoreductase delta subunit